MLKKTFVISTLSIMYAAVSADSKPADMSNAEMQKAIASVPTHTIKAKSRTPEENLRHKKFCAEQGGIDVTDEADVQVGAGTTDAIFCRITDLEKYKKYEKKTPKVGNINSNSPLNTNTLAILDEEIYSSDTTGNLPPYDRWVSAHPINGSINTGPYFVRGTGNHVGATPGTGFYIFVSVPALQCVANQAWSVQSQSGTHSLTANCFTRISGSFQTVNDVFLPDHRWRQIARGTISFN